MDQLYTELRWLPRVPADFTSRLKAMELSSTPASEMQALAGFGLNLNQLTKLARAVHKARTDGKSLEPLIPFRLAVLSNSTIDLIAPALVASGARHGIALEIIQPAYDQVAQEALTPDSW